MQYLKEEVRQEILQSAIDEFYQKEYKGASMRNIAQSANMTVGNLYRYFKNKDELFDGLVTPVIGAITGLINNHEKHTLFENGNYEELNGFLAKALMNIHDNYPKQLYALIHGSKGSNFANFKEDFTDQLAEHLQSHCYLTGGCRGDVKIEPVIYKVLAQNDVDGYITILESDLPREEKIRAISQFAELMTSVSFCNHTLK